MNHRRAKVGRDLKRSSGPTFHGKESINETEIIYFILYFKTLLF